MTASLRVALALLAEQGTMVLGVVDELGNYVGVVTRAQLERTSEMDRSTTPVRSLLPAAIDPLTPDQSLDDALEQLADGGVAWLPVVVNHRVVGGLGVRAVGTYKNAVPTNSRRARALPEDTSIFDVQLRADSPVIGHTLRDAGLPGSLLVAAIRRDGETVFPNANTRLEAGDVLTVLAEPAREGGLKRFVDPPVSAD